MHERRNIERNGEKLQKALTALAALDQQAEHGRIHGKVFVEIIYQNGVADRIRTGQESVVK